MSPESRIVFPRISIEVKREEIPVDSLSPSKVPDPQWRYVDKKGHGHFWDGKELPTLKWVVTGTRWVGDEYDAYEVKDGEWRCTQCGETIEPKKRTEYGPRYVSGLTWIILTIDGEHFQLTPEQFGKSVDKWKERLRKDSFDRLG